MQPLYLAVDAGGSRTTYVLARGERVLARSESGSIKRIRVSAEVAERHLSEGLSALVRLSGILLSDVARTCVGTAGESIPLVADWIGSAFAEHVGGSLLMTSDVAIALDAAFFGGAGVLVLAGTGSNVAARTSGGRVTTVGGWGPVLGDPGAGYTIGRQGLRAAFRAVDRGEAPLLLDRLHALWGTTTPVEVMSYVYSSAAPDLATLAPLVAACALDGDADCAMVLRRNGEDLAQTVLLAIARLQAMGESDLPMVACAGSILGHVPAVREAMTTALQQVHSQIVVLSGVVDPVMGALWQARTLL
jgi:N-acetylglucosamine kinase-like BadF-type ATPase